MKRNMRFLLLFSILMSSILAAYFISGCGDDSTIFESDIVINDTVIGTIHGTVQDAGGGRKHKEVFELDVIDGARGTSARSADRFSKGEKTLISEALKLALAIFNAKRQPYPLRTLWRDECDGPLEPELAAK